MDIVQLIRRLRAHGFALSMLFEKQTLSLISKKSKGKPFEEEVEPVEEVSSENNLWGSHDMFSKAEKEGIAKKELQNALKEKMMGKGGGGGNSKALRQLGVENTSRTKEIDSLVNPKGANGNDEENWQE